MKKSSCLKLEENPHCPIRFSKPVSSPDFQIALLERLEDQAEEPKTH
jgi:hypothetical protein